MRKNTFLIHLFAGLISVSMTGCASPISKEVKKEADESISFIKVLENPKAFHGVVVIWGGVIIRAVNHADNKNALFLWETPLDLRGKPKGEGLSEGMFIARTSEFLDPKAYVSGRKVTIAGEIIGEQLGEYRGVPYVYPVIKIREIHLWEAVPAIQWNWGRIPFYLPNEFTPDEERTEPLR